MHRADLNHPVSIAEHGNAVGLGPASNRADLTARRVRRDSVGMTEEANASGNAWIGPRGSGLKCPEASGTLPSGKQMTTDARRLMRPAAEA